MHTRHPSRPAAALVVTLLSCAGFAACGGAESDAANDAGSAAQASADREASGVQVPTPGDDGSVPPAGELSGPPYGFEVWHEDFPGSPEKPHLSPREPGKTYLRSRSQAVDSVIAKLVGNCSRDAWRFATDLFERVRDEEVSMRLGRELDAALSAPERTDHAENIAQAIGRAGNPVAAPSLLRALDHDQRAVREAAMRGLVRAGDADSVRAAYAYLRSVGGRGILGWLEAAVRHLPEADLVQAFRELMLDEQLTQLRTKLVELSIAKSPKFALEVLRPFIGNEPPGLHPSLAVLRHLAGEAGGSVEVREMLRHEAPQTRSNVLIALRIGGAADFRGEVLTATTDPDPTVRFNATATTGLLEGEDVDLALEARTIDESVEVRREALAILGGRGFVGPLEELCEVVRRASGTRMQNAIEDLLAARYPGVVAPLLDRLKAAEGVEERRGLLRAAALTRTAESFLPLRDTFVATDPESMGMRKYVAYLMANCRGAETAVLELFEGWPTDQYRERAWLLHTLGNIAADREDAEVKEAVYTALRSVLNDAEEIPQMRLCALQYLRRDLGFEDVVPLRQLAAESEPRMRAALSDFMFEFF